MKYKIYVNNIFEQNSSTHGAAVLDKTIWQDLEIMFQGKGHTLNNLKLLTKQPNSFYTFTRYYQYIAFIQYQPLIGISIKFTDFHNDTDTALDEYLALGQHEWKKEDRDKIMQIFQIIQADTSEDSAEMVIVDPVG